MIGGTTRAAPGIPVAPTLLYQEDFENRPDPLQPVMLNDYQGGIAAKGTRYTADPYWLDVTKCNGMVHDFRLVFAACDGNGRDNEAARFLARGMSAFHGDATKPETVLSGYSIVPVLAPGRGVQFQTVDALPFQQNRFVTFSVDTSAANCLNLKARPLLRFSLLTAGNEVPLSSADEDVCSEPYVDHELPYEGVLRVARGKVVFGSKPVLTTFQQAQLRLVNAQVEPDGNDMALDNVRLIDVTPKLDKQFATGPLAGGAYGVGKPAKLTFTITNRTDLLIKEGWSFTDTLPSGLVIASPNNLNTNCTNLNTFAIPGSSNFTVATGTLSGNMTSCTISVDVSSARAGTYINNSSNFSNVRGLDNPGEAVVTFVTEPVIRLQKQLARARLDAADQFNLNLAGPSPSDGNAAVTTSGAGTDILPAAPLTLMARTNVPYTLSESASNAAREALYAAAYSCVNSGPPGSPTVLPSGTGKTFTVTPLSASDNILCTFTNSPAGADLAVLKTSSSAAVQSGDVVTYTIRASNSGPAAADGAVLTDVPGAGLACQTEPALVARAECVASGNASCPALSPNQLIDALFGSGVVIPTFPSDGKIVVTLQCRVSATGN